MWLQPWVLVMLQWWAHQQQQRAPCLFDGHRASAAPQLLL
jgi:hypothetical protein